MAHVSTTTRVVGEVPAEWVNLLHAGWKTVLLDEVDGWNFWDGEQIPRRKKHHMRTRRLALRRLAPLTWADLRTFRDRGLAANEAMRVTESSGRVG